jgi:hypothetical protein
MRTLTIATALLLGPALVLAPALASAQTAVPDGELLQLIQGRTVTSGRAQLAYGTDGSYTFNGRNPGHYRVANGQICVDFNRGGSRCDTIVREGDQLFMVNGAGQRFDFQPQDRNAAAAATPVPATPVPDSELLQLIQGRTVTSGRAQLAYGADGSYTYNGRNPGHYRVANGQICVDFNRGGSRCDTIVREGNQLFMINRAGQRFAFQQPRP